jgi:hypothetical protein
MCVLLEPKSLDDQASRSMSSRSSLVTLHNVELCVRCELVIVGGGKEWIERASQTWQQLQKVSQEWLKQCLIQQCFVKPSRKSGLFVS